MDFLSINSELMAYSFQGTLEYKPNTAEASENMATVTITPIAGSKRPIYDAREMVEETVCLKNSINETIKIGGSIDFAAKQTEITSLSFKIEKIEATTNKKTDMLETTNYLIEKDESGKPTSKITFNTAGLMVITVSATGYAPWVTTVYVDGTT
jgi:hypothetical protein